MVRHAQKEPIERRKALAVLDGVRHLYVTKGRRVLHFDLDQDRPSDRELLALIVGPSGRLRAPTVRRGRAMIVGYDEETYETLFT